MKKRTTLFIVLFVLISVVMLSCSSGNKIGGSSKRCGCGVNKGMVGY